MTDPLTPEGRAELRRLLAWYTEALDARSFGDRSSLRAADEIAFDVAAEARTALPALLDENERLRAEVERLQHSLNCIMCSTPMQVTTRIHTCPSCRTGHVEQLRARFPRCATPEG